MPNFDDVVDLLENAERDLEHELGPGGHDQPIAKVRTWRFGTAHLWIRNLDEYLDHRDLLAFLGGIRESGFEFGFWEGRLAFYDNVFTAIERGTGVLSRRADEESDE